ncbi:hypothetical protein BDR03DRAFT_986720 [Suillus americanus]|nr:hypothetical protein BDR03DRAFT_986720 [Suillus americanus]
MPTQALTSSHPNVVAVAKVLFDSSKEAISSGTINSTYNFDIHSFIQNLTDARQYCPLILFSTENTEHLHWEGQALKHSKIQFERKLSLNTLTWQEAYQQYLTWITDDEAVHKNFQAILEFNIKTCQNYSLCPHQHNQAEWEARLPCKNLTFMLIIMSLIIAILLPHKQRDIGKRFTNFCKVHF